MPSPDGCRVEMRGAWHLRIRACSMHRLAEDEPSPFQAFLALGTTDLKIAFGEPSSLPWEEPGTRQEPHLEMPISRVATAVDVAHERTTSGCEVKGATSLEPRASSGIRGPHKDRPWHNTGLGMGMVNYLQGCRSQMNT